MLFKHWHFPSHSGIFQVFFISPMFDCATSKVLSKHIMNVDRLQWLIERQKPWQLFTLWKLMPMIPTSNVSSHKFCHGTCVFSSDASFGRWTSKQICENFLGVPDTLSSVQVQAVTMVRCRSSHSKQMPTKENPLIDSSRAANRASV